MLVVLFLSAILATIFFGTVASTQGQYRVQRDTRMAEEALRTADLVLRTILQNAGADPLQTGAGLIRADTLGTGSFDNLAVRSDFNPPNGSFNDLLESVTVRVLADTLQVKWSTTGDYQALAYPVNSVLFEFFGTDGTPLTDIADVHSGANSVRYTISAPERPGSTTLRSRQSWIFLQNRR
jgi:type II secretory pathway pseudopilin PulG